MSNLLSVSKISKTMGSKNLFDDLSFGVSQRERLGLLGPNGAGKSTLLRIMAGVEEVDSGEVSVRKGVRLAFVQQEESFSEGSSVLDTASRLLESHGMEALEAQVQAAIYLGMAGFEDVDQDVGKLSGGWKKRLSLSVAFAQEPDLLILDEPTNHMDWDGILWLEGQLKVFKQAFVLVSHDREFLDALCEKTMEIHRLYRDGFLAFECGYKKFLVRKEEYILAQASLEESMSNKARREVDWLRAGVKARTTKSSSRIKEAHQLLDKLADVKSRNQAGKAKVRVEIDAGGRRSKKLIDLKGITVAYGDHILVKDLDLTLGPKMCLGLLGDNGSGKSSLLKAIVGSANNYSGELFKADGLKVVYFDQKREDLPQDIDLVQFLGDGSDYTVFKGESIHVASYASRFLFPSEKMKLKISQLSGGEQARLLLAKLLLQPADVLILDEPTNDLDIGSIEILEESLSSFSGLVLLVSHDRYFLSELCQKYLALQGQGAWQMYPDLNQWLAERNRGPGKESVKDQSPKIEKGAKPKKKAKRKLSYKEQRQAETIEKDIEIAESELEAAQKSLEDPENFSNHEKMNAALAELDTKKKRVDELYAFWEILEGSQS